MANPYEVLGVDPGAEAAAIEAAYRERIKEVHPDQGGSAEAFLEVKAAYEALEAGLDEQYPGADGRHPREGNGTDPAAEAGTGAEPANGASEPTGSRVEYLNFSALEDHGWRLGDPNLFEKAADAGLPPEDHGRFLVEPDESLLEAAENRGFAWPYACRGGACANCAVVVHEGELSQPVDHILPDEMVGRGIRLSCNGKPLTDTLRVVYNVKHLPELDELRLPPRPFERAYSD